ncbi:MAG: helicase-related protein [Candidatus Caldarchaeum sp.]
MITVGSRVKIKTRDEQGTVLELRDNFAKVLTQSSDYWVPLEDLEEDLTLIDRLIRGDLDDGIDFILSIDAYRLLTEFKFNPYVLASSTKITIFPHQIDEVAKILDNPRMLLADEVGLGKTITAGLVACELKHRGLANRLLFAVPKSLLYKWRDELQQRFDLNVEILNSEYVKIHGDPLAKRDFCYVSSMDYLKQDHVLKMFDRVEMDITVVDEAHKMSLGTERLKLGEKLCEKSSHMLLLTATPHNGDDEDYLARMRLLDPYVTDVNTANYLLIRNLKEDVIDLDGKEVFPPRNSKTVEVQLSDEEKRIHRMVDDYVFFMLEKARDKQEYNAAKFLGTIFRKRASSSFRALKLTLERRITRLGSSVDALSTIRRAKEAEEEFDEEDYENSEYELVGYALSKNEEEEIVRRILTELDKLEGKDSKLQRLLDFIKTLKEGDKDAKIVVFSEYRDTVDYLFEELSKRYRVEQITGLMGIEERYQALMRFRDPTGAEIMVCTDAAGEGIDMQFCNIMMNYDLPWNPNRLEQRMGRIHRIGQRKTVYYYNFLLYGTIDGYIFSTLLERIEAIKQAIGDKVYDTLGRLITEDAVTELYEELLRAPREEWEARIKRLDGILEERRRILERINMLLVGHRLDRTKLEETRRIKLEAVDRGEVKRFVEVYLNRNGGRIETVDTSLEMYRIFLPRRVAQQVGRSIDVGSFLSSVAQERACPYLALGNKYVMAMVQDAIKPVVSSFKHSYLNGLLFIYRVIIKDGKQQDRDGKIVAVLFSNGSIREADPRVVWDLDPAYDSITVLEPNQVEQRKSTSEEYLKYVIENIKAKCDSRLKQIKDKTTNIVLEYAARKSDEIRKRIAEYRSKLREAPYYAGLIKRAENELTRLKEGMEKRLKDLNEIYKTYALYELIGIAVITSGGDVEAKKIVERAGIEAVISYEKDRAKTDEDKRKIRDVSDSYKGYDVESFDRVIEVKSFKETGPIELTSHEWETAKRMGDLYWLYVVENAIDNPTIHQIKNPGEAFKEKVKKIPIVDYRYIIEGWK